ncbi:uncharacterized protein [Aegilops tauschii subsp. strangulata]|uniref:uncharacterized protein n=1 Tax=Aegilops tauschii subsp. strangulata TaxID=200361 RepID=UPI003CC84C29
MASPLLRSSAAILRRSNPRAWTFPRRPGQSSVEGPRFLSSGAGGGGGGGGVVEPKACCVAHMRTEAALEKLNENLCVMEKDIGTLLEHERRLERSEQFHKRLSYVLIPGAAAFFVFCPDKKREPSTEGQLGI